MEQREAECDYFQWDNAQGTTRHALISPFWAMSLKGCSVGERGTLTTSYPLVRFTVDTTCNLRSWCSVYWNAFCPVLLAALILILQIGLRAVRLRSHFGGVWLFRKYFRTQCRVAFVWVKQFARFVVDVGGMHWPVIYYSHSFVRSQFPARNFQSRINKSIPGTDSWARSFPGGGGGDVSTMKQLNGFSIFFF